MRRGATTSAERLASAGLTHTHGAVLVLLAALAWAVVRRGAFYPEDAGVLLLGVTLSLAVAVTGGSRLLQQAQWRVVAAVALLLSWWLVSALLWGLPSGEIARFAHNEPLQLLASAGVVGLLLLLLLVFAVYRATKAISRPARVALAIFACCACFDFVAHIPALTTMSGLLAATMKEAPA